MPILWNLFNLLIIRIYFLNLDIVIILYPHLILLRTGLTIKFVKGKEEGFL